MSPSVCVLTVLLAAMAQPASTGSGSADAEFEALQRGFVTLYESLRAAGGVAPGDETVIRIFRQRAMAFTARHRVNVELRTVHDPSQILDDRPDRLGHLHIPERLATLSHPGKRIV